ncbi:MAG: polysaccharide pyruvyl transferase family protein, partial [Planctomycetota bacterium]
MADRNPLFILFGNGPFQNHGCEAILRSTIDILTEEFGPCRFTNSLLYWREVDYVDDLGTEVIHQVPAPEKKRKKRRQFLPSWFKKPFRRYIPYLPSWLKKPFRRQAPQHPRELFETYLPESVAALAVGGDNYSLDYYGVAKRCFQANTAVLRHKKPLVLWGVSVGPFSKDPEFEKYASQELKKVSLICARESETVDYLASIGVKENVCLVADPAFLLKPSPIDNNALELKMIRQPCIGLNFSPLMSRYWNQDGSWEDCVYECINEMLKKFDLPIILIPHVVWSYSDDHRFMQTIVERLNVSKDRLLLIGRDYN